MTQDKPKNKAAQSLGSLGGKAGKGAAKRRSAEHYAKMVAARAEQRKARAEEISPAQEKAMIDRLNDYLVTPEWEEEK